MKRSLEEVVAATAESVVEEEVKQTPKKKKAKKMGGSGGGLKKSTDKVKNNARVALHNNYVLRRCVQDIEHFPELRKVLVNVIKITPITTTTKASHNNSNSSSNSKSILSTQTRDFYVLNLARLTKSGFLTELEKAAKATTTTAATASSSVVSSPTETSAETEAVAGATTASKGERVWVYVQDKGVIQASLSEVAACCGIEEGEAAAAACIMLGSLRVDADCAGKARVEAQKVGTRLRPESKLACCIQLDFGAANAPSNRYLWVEQSLIENNNSTTNSGPSSPASPMTNNNSGATVAPTPVASPTMNGGSGAAPEEDDDDDDEEDEDDVARNEEVAKILLEIAGLVKQQQQQQKQ